MYTLVTLSLLAVSVAAQNMGVNAGAAANTSTPAIVHTNTSSVASHPSTLNQIYPQMKSSVGNTSHVSNMTGGQAVVETSKDQKRDGMNHLDSNSMNQTVQVPASNGLNQTSAGSATQNAGATSESNAALQSAIAKLLTDISMTNADIAVTQARVAQETAAMQAQQPQTTGTQSAVNNVVNSTQAANTRAIPSANLSMAKRQATPVAPSPAPGSGPTIIPILKSPGINGSTVVVSNTNGNGQVSLVSAMSTNASNPVRSATSNLTLTNAAQSPDLAVEVSFARLANQNISSVMPMTTQLQTPSASNLSSLQPAAVESSMLLNLHSENMTTDAQKAQKAVYSGTSRNQATLAGILFVLGGVVLFL